MQSDKNTRMPRYGWWITAVIAAIGLLELAFLGINTHGGAPQPRRSAYPAPGSVPFHAGDLAIISESSGLWPCGSTKDALDQLIKWAGDRQEYARTMRKLLDEALGVRKIRLLGVLEDGKLESIPETGRECWTVREAIR